MSVISTYLNDNAQTPLNRFLVYILYKQVCNRHGDKTNRWSLGLSVRGLTRSRCDNQSRSCAHLLIAARQVATRIVSKSTVRSFISSGWRLTVGLDVAQCTSPLATAIGYPHRRLSPHPDAPNPGVMACHSLPCPRIISCRNLTRHASRGGRRTHAL